MRIAEHAILMLFKIVEYMKSVRFFLIFVLMTCLSVSAQTTLKEKLQALPEISEIVPLEKGEFGEKYLVYFTQPIDHQNPSLGTFKQRVFVSHLNFKNPTVMVTEGYGAEGAKSPRYRNELSRLFETNQVVVEHRYFLESTPNPKDWTYLTTKQSAADLHAICMALKKVYPGKWITTGASKGGQTTALYRTYYPDDVDISVPYVAPLNYGVEDGRHEPFIRNVSTAADRKVVQDFQMEVFKRRATLQPMFEKHCKDNNLTFPVTMGEIYDFSVLEYSFAMWQYGFPISKIPRPTASDKEIFDHWIQQCNPSNFNKEGYFKSFFVQAAKELGYYGYDIKPFKKYMELKSTKGWLSRLLLPDELKGVKFDKTMAKDVTKFLKKNDPKMIYIYGEFDPWSASGVCAWLNTSKKKNLHVYVIPGGNHGARIGVMQEPMQSEVKALIQKWLNE